MTPRRHPVQKRGFSLVELLTVMSIIALLASFSVPAMQSLFRSGAVNRAAGDLSGTFECARSYAMSQNTYVRVGLACVPVGSTASVPTLVVIVISSVDGSLTYDSASDMADNTRWKPLTRPLILGNVWTYKDLNATNAPNTSKDSLAENTDIPAFSRTAGRMGPVTFTSIVQFAPSGEAQVLKAESARYIKIGLDQPQQPNAPENARNENPFVLRLAGINGRIDILRKENLN
jgi:prepilin-type N-terminal cleavage/methylation domain-containing protein